MMENRSFDNLFGRFPGANGARTGNRGGQEVPLRRCPEWLPGDLAHDTLSWGAMYDDGKMDGFGIGAYGAEFAYTQFAAQDIPNYFHWAERFVFCDNLFASVAGPSLPEPPVPHRRPGGWRDRQPGEHPDEAPQRWPGLSRAGAATPTATTCTSTRASATAPIHCSACVLLRVRDRRPAAVAARDRLGQLLGRSVSGRLHLAGVLRRSRTSSTTGELWDEHIWPVDDLMRDIEANALPPGHVDHARGSSCPTIRRSARSTRTTGSPTS